MATTIQTPTLDRFIEACRQSLADAADRQDWQSALDATFNGMLWRVVRLAIRLNIVPLTFNPEISWKLTALQLRSICGHALAQAGEGEEIDYRIEVVSDVLNALMDVAAALESGQAKTDDGAFQLTISAANLGRCELMLGFAEEGFWEQIYLWRSRKVGRTVGVYAEWKGKAAKHLSDWIADHQESSVDERIDELAQWLEDSGNKRSRETAKSAYYQLIKAKLIVMPPKHPRSKKLKKLSRDTQSKL